MPRVIAIDWRPIHLHIFIS